MSFKIILADDHPLILTGIRSLIEQITPHCEVVAEAYQVSDLLKLLQQHHCDLLITDFSMPGDTRSDGMVMIQQLRRDYPTLPIIVLTQIQNSGILQSLIQAGVNGLILKKSVINELADAIRQILLGHRYIGPAVKMLLANAGLAHHDNINPLTAKESEVVRLLASGMSVTQVADYLHRSVKTISTQKKSAMVRLGLQSDSELFQYAKEHGF
ncbi:response regulator [Aeromonas veronii]|uniref:response regulator n=1 Tax=Aeromonas veronii TaxID=654 RepID=UPI001117514A|nr:response regulator [Aeromonas veronii]MBE8737091.1 response regulator [Aeromonas veronii]MBE8741503.1 response regulator [Aeromonas veronii]MBE8745637.1 response regulator [Aeromonas veronii]MBE8765336.1 response regulator [Aeromonas veronii]MBE8841357.1 response regulator [Aeromonas veronii]